MVQSILSCSASKSGQRILHFDGNDYYGEQYSSRTLTQFLQFCVAPSTDEEFKNLVQMSDVPFIRTSPQFHLVELVHKVVQSTDRYQSKSSIHPSTVGYIMDKARRHELDDSVCDRNITNPTFWGYVHHKNLTPGRVSRKDREFNIDFVSKLLFASGKFVDILIKSGVCNYLEFKSSDKIRFYLPHNNSSSSEKSNESLFCQVPGSKSDIFNLKYLTIMDKRSLMKFLQFVLDWGKEQYEGELIATINEKDTSLGGSLQRPQNKDSTAHRFHLAGFEDKTFESFLQHSNLSSRLIPIIIYALCLESNPLNHTNPIKTVDAMKMLYLHINSFGCYSSAAFLVPQYGSSEIPQAFCRMSAVWGTTFILRRNILSVNKILDSCDDPNDTKVNNAADVFESKDLMGDGKENNSSNEKEQCKLVVVDDTNRRFECNKFLCSTSNVQILDKYVDELLFNGISIGIGLLLDVSSSVFIIPPQSSFEDEGVMKNLGNPNTVCVYQLDHTSSVTAEGTCMIRVITTFPIESSEKVPECQYFDIKKASQNFEVKSKELMANIIRLLTISSKQSSNYEEIVRCVTLLPIYSKSLFKEQPYSKFGVFLCGDNSGAFHFEEIVNSADELMQQMFPGSELFPTQYPPAEESYEEDFDDLETILLQRTLKSCNQIE